MHKNATNRKLNFKNLALTTRSVLWVVQTPVRVEIEWRENKATGRKWCEIDSAGQLPTLRALQIHLLLHSSTYEKGVGLIMEGANCRHCALYKFIYLRKGGRPNNGRCEGKKGERK